MDIKSFLLSYLQSENYEPIRVQELAEFFGLEGEERLDFYHIIDDLLAQEVIRMTKRGKVLAYIPSKKKAKKSHKKAKKDKDSGLNVDSFFQTEDMPVPLIEEEEYSQEIITDEEKTKEIEREDQAQSQELEPASDDGASEGAVTGKKNEGRLQGNAKGFAFFISDNPEMEDVFIGQDDLNGALHGDRVRIQIINQGNPAKGKKVEGRVMEVLSRNPKKIVGRYQDMGDYGFVIPDQKAYFKDIYIDGGNAMDARENDKVLVKIDRFEKEKENPEGHVLMVIGPMDGKGVDITSVAMAFDLPYEFSEETRAEVGRLPKNLEPEDKKGRKDLRKLYTVTIDGADAKDFDDAISVEKRGKYYNLYVHIADVSHYVKEGTALDKDAYARGNSVYLLDRVIPMLPEELSNGLCSLLPGEDRLAMTTQMTLDEEGRVVDYQFYRSLIRSDHRLVYEDVSDFLEFGKTFTDDGSLYDRLDLMEFLFNKLHRRRIEEGAIDFNFPEIRVVLDEEGRPVEVGQEERRVANRIIEEFMILNNEVVGRHFYDLKIPYIYRIHGLPSPEAIDRLNRVLQAYHYPMISDNAQPKDLQEILQLAEGKKEESFIQMVVLTSLQKAIYSPSTTMHFGLAADHYSHFTAPIRRYSDLIAHRLLKAWLDGHPKNDSQVKEKIFDQCLHITETEQNAEDAEHDVVDMKCAEYMQQFIGDSFTGVVSSLTNFGVFIALENQIEGLAHFRDMTDDYYTYDEDHFLVRGERSNRKIHYGDRLTVLLTGSNPETREIDFRILWPDEVKGQNRSNFSQKSSGRRRAKSGRDSHRTGSKGMKGGKPSKAFQTRMEKASGRQKNRKPFSNRGGRQRKKGR
ncbi:ribonuclease R [Kallipyga gabonensis]|uniref:ribonuclease R n=1 Tax=Kallipyga gabonensis TaxID=1686287 RepID=UPI0006B3FC13|nr:ribonuclease R [Kallipyga gabonensis]